MSPRRRLPTPIAGARAGGKTRMVRIATSALMVVAGVWFASSWIDQGDATCGSLWTPGHWIGRCDRRILLRGTVATGLVVLGLVIGVGGGSLSKGDRGQRLAVVAVGAIGLAAIALVTNEFVRSGGLWAQ